MLESSCIPLSWFASVQLHHLRQTIYSTGAAGDHDLAWDHLNLAADIKHALLQWSLRHAGPRSCTMEPCNQHHIEVIVRPLWTAPADEYRSHAKQSRFPRPMDIEPSRSPEQHDRIDSRSFLEL